MRPESPICTLGKLIEYAEAGGYCVPADLLAAHQAHRRLTSLNVEPSPAATRQGVAERLATGKALDPLDLAAELVAGQALRDREAKAAEVLRYAVELSAEALASLAAAMTQRIVTEHLRPALAEILDQAREHAAARNGYDLDGDSLITDPRRDAYL